ncbi:hypothetical protein KSE1242_22770 (plasmid) [Staphylococcus epidermidis]|uniref:hypothetical protein n=1 Tax=Staphylococcus epidermidis TaxID=1282 RepID=UPI00138AF84F|nr:hypothetical protein [Staphylococcus epidermidis]MCG2189247.1 hypothetical protein [Staphylococcus epidermidis]MDU3509772.1 hypothetical protein [Staphylococcus warneri]HEQ3959380.1 hypothetical protein [Streptococcus pyogenes]
MDIDLNNSIYSTYASLKIFRPQAILGTLYLLNDCIYFKYRGFLEGHEIKNIFYFENIKSIRFGFSFSPFRIVITEKNGENWIFDQVPKKNAREFVEKFDFINNYN